MLNIYTESYGSTYTFGISFYRNDYGVRAYNMEIMLGNLGIVFEVGRKVL